MQHFALNNGTVFILAEAAGGIYSSEQLKAICAVADGDSTFLKVTEDQRLGFMAKVESLPEIQSALAKVGVLVRPYRNAGTPTAKSCLGELCPQKEQDALSDSIDVGTHLAKKMGLNVPFVSIGMNGCMQACVSSATDDIHIIGETSGYKISIGGKSSELPQIGQFLIENVAKEKLGEVVEKILGVYCENQQENERLYEVVERIGMTAFIEAAESVLGGSVGSEDELELDESGEGEPSIEEASMEAEQPEENRSPAVDSFAEEPMEESFLDEENKVDTAETSAYDNSDIIVEDVITEEEIVTDFTDEKFSESQYAKKKMQNLADDESDEMDLESSASNAATPKTSSHSFDDESADLSSSQLISEEGDIEVEEATADDVDTMTRNIRSEVAMEEQLHNKLTQPELRPRTQAPTFDDDTEMDVEMAARPSTQTTSGRFKVKFTENTLCLTLPNHMELQLTLDVLSENTPFVMEIGDDLLSFTRHGHMLEVHFGGISMQVPVVTSGRLAA